MSLMELFSNYTPKTAYIDPETEKGNHGNLLVGAAVTAIAPVTPSSNRGNQGNYENVGNKVKLENEAIREYLEERAAIMEFDGGLSRKQAEQAATTAIRVYCYRVKDKANSELIAIMPNTELDEAYQNLKLKYGDRLLTVYESQRSEANQKNINNQSPTTKGINP